MPPTHRRPTSGVSRQPFCRSDTAATDATSTTTTAAADTTTAEYVKAMRQKAQSCAHPKNYMKCVMGNVMLAKLNSTVPAQDCTQYCTK